MGEWLESHTREDLGLYLESLMAHPSEEEGKLMVIANFMIGDRAWEDKVQNPVRHAETQQTREMIQDAGLEDPTEQLKEQWKGLLGE